MAPAVLAPEVRGLTRVHDSFVRVVRSRELLRMWRHRHPRIAGAADDRSIRGQVREALNGGQLAPINGVQAWPAGYGSERLCHVCRREIRRRDLEYELANPPGLLLVPVHSECLVIWREESVGHAMSSPLRSGIAGAVDLLMTEPTCRGCLAKGLGMTADMVEIVLTAIRNAFVIRCDALACPRCGDVGDVLSMTPSR